MLPNHKVSVLCCMEFAEAVFEISIARKHRGQGNYLTPTLVWEYILYRKEKGENLLANINIGSHEE